MVQKTRSRKAGELEVQEVLTGISVPDIKSRIGKKMALRSIFKMNALLEELSGIDLEKVASAWRWEHEMASLLAHTYTMSGYSTQNSASDEEDTSYIKGWEILPAGDDFSCPYCKEASRKTYPKSNRPRVPLHIGCRCTVFAKI